MPVAAQLSRKLYETFGDEAAAEMVNWMDRVEAQRAELRELNELNFARIQDQFRRVGERFSQVDERLRRVDAQFSNLRRGMDAAFAGFRHEMDARFAQFEATIVGRLEAKIEQRTADLMKWSFVFWVGAVAVVAALAGVLR